MVRQGSDHNLTIRKVLFTNDAMLARVVWFFPSLCFMPRIFARLVCLISTKALCQSLQYHEPRYF